jgi:hypothetical protein
MIKIMLKKISSSKYLKAVQWKNFIYDKVSVKIFVDGCPLPKEILYSYKPLKKTAKLVTKFYLGSRKKTCSMSIRI